ncbi:MAG: DUF3137 domain-containing protein [Flavobacteriales bacterium]|nr:DUF3137 domain-containing protein [Flavobacteriales bacterium]
MPEQAVEARFDELEQIRNEANAKKNRIHWIFGPILFAVLAVLLMYTSFPFPFMGVIVVAGGWFYFINKENEKFGKLFKTKVMVPSLLKRFPHLTYHEKGISKEHFLTSELYKISKVDRYKSEDMFSGVHGKTKFRFCEAHAEEKRKNSKGGSSYHTVFQGVYMIADFNKSLKGTTRVLQASDNFIKKLFNRKTQVSLDHPEFEEIFNTYSDDQIEARYILSPAMMERIVELQSRWDEDIRISFIRDHVFIAIHHKKNLFEANMKKEINADQVKRIYEEVEMCLSIIDLLDLNTRIWTKE